MAFCEYHEKLWSSHLKTQQLRDKLIHVIRDQQVVCNKHAQVLLLQRSLSLLREECEKEKSQLAKRQEELKLLKRNNDKKEGRLKRAREKDFTKKIQSVQKEFSRKQVTAQRTEDELVTIRRQLVRRTVHWVFPLSLEQQKQVNTGGQTDNVVSNSVGKTKKGGEREEGDRDSVYKTSGEDELEDDWVLSGVSTAPSTPLAYICNGFLPANGDMSEYIDIVKMKKKESQQSKDHHEDDAAIPCHHSDLYTSVPAALTCIVHSVTLVANLLDRPLPYPISLPVALCEYGQIQRRLKAVLTSLTKMNDNVMYLCFTQLVPLENLAIGHVLQNLHSLVEHEKLGRGGPFTCHPHLLQHTFLVPQSPQESTAAADWDNTPPLLHLADKDGLIQASTDSSSDEEEALVDGDYLKEDATEEWEEVEDINKVPYFRVGDRLEYGQVYGDYTGGRGRQAQLKEGESTIQSTSGLLETLGSLLGSGFRNY